MIRARAIAAVLCLLALLPNVRGGQPDPDAGEGPQVIALNFTPAPAPRPALRYRLTYTVSEQKPGNAAETYRTAMRLYRDARQDQDEERLRAWMRAPDAPPPADEADALLGRQARALDALVDGTRHTDCDWGLSIHEQGFDVRLPFLHDMRALAGLLNLRARRALERGDFEAALADFRAGFTLARHIGRGDTLIEGLVGVAIAERNLDVATRFIGTPGAPNLYWALSDLLPAPFLSLKESVRWEGASLVRHLGLTEAERPLHSEDFHRMVRGMQGLAAGGFNAEDEIRARVAGTLGGLVLYPRARRALLAEGLSEESVDRLPVAEVLARYFLDTYTYHHDEIFKWAGLPIDQAWAGMVRAQRELEQACQDDPVATVLPGLMLPAMTHAALQFAYLDRHLAALRCIEAVRLYADGHGGRMPDDLDEEAAVPVPPDPLTSGPFVYRKDGATARLEALALPGDRARRGRVYELTVAPPVPMPEQRP